MCDHLSSAAYMQIPDYGYQLVKPTTVLLVRLYRGLVDEDTPVLGKET